MSDSPDICGKRLDSLLSWVSTRYDARFQLRAAVWRFIDDYRDQAGSPRPFAGRASLLQQLDAWRHGSKRLLVLSGRLVAASRRC